MLQQKRESLVFIDHAPCKLRYRNIVPGSVRLYYDYKCTPIDFCEGTDYTVDHSAGVIKAQSKKIGNYNQSNFYHKERFDHTQFETYGNYNYTYYIDYSFHEGEQLSNVNKASELMKSSIKIKNPNKPLRYVVFGDSISTGAEASESSKAFFTIFAEALQSKFNYKVEVLNASTGGDTSSDGLRRFERVLALQGDIVTLAFGMNDQNRAGENGEHFVEPETYEANLRQMIVDLQKQGALVVLVSPCLPNKRWNWTSGDTVLYSRILQKLAVEFALPFADVTSLWKNILALGKTEESLLLNDINHPNDFGHSLYAEALCALLA